MNLPGIYRGIVVSNKDPEKRGRIQVRVPAVSGDQVYDWAWPVEPPDSYADCDHTITTSTTSSHTHTVDLDHVKDQVKVRIPKVGQGVWVMFEAGDPNYPVWLGTFGVTVTRFDNA